MASASEKAGLGPKGLVLALIGLAVVVAGLLWWKSQARDRARAQLVSAYGATIEPEAFTEPDYHFHALIELADAADAAFEA